MTDEPMRNLNVRVDARMVSELQRIADERYEGRLSMALREAIRKFLLEREEREAA